MEEEEFRFKAAEAEQLAEKSKSLTARQRWHRIAQGWLAMLGRPSHRPTSRDGKDEPSPTPAENRGRPVGSG